MWPNIVAKHSTQLCKWGNLKYNDKEKQKQKIKNMHIFKISLFEIFLEFGLAVKYMSN